MARLKEDVKIDDAAFDKAKNDLDMLYASAEELKGKFEELFNNLADALQCESGDELKKAGHDVVIEPIKNLQLVIQQVSNTLESVKDGKEYYKGLFDDFETLKNDIT